MRNLLQNKLVVSGLVGIAIAVVGWRVHSLRQRFSPGGTAQARETTPLTPPPSAPAPAALVPPASATNLAAAGPALNTRLAEWRELFPDKTLTRDPFTTLLLPAEVKIQPLIPPPSGSLLSLNAISIEPQLALAVINGQIVAVGDSVGDFTVDRILPSEVWLGHTNGRTILRMDFRPSATAANNSEASPPQP